MSIGPLRCGWSKRPLYLFVLLFCGVGLVDRPAQTQTDVDARDYFGQTGLMRAAEKGDTATVNALIRASANVNLADKTGRTALAASAYGGKLEVVQALIKAGADLNARDLDSGRTALVWATDFGGTAVAKALIEAGAELNIADNAGRTALMHAASLGHSETVHELINAGANPNQKDKNGNSALTHAAWACHADIVRDLMKAGATLGPQEWTKKRPPKFEDFLVHNIYKGATAPVDLHSNPEARTYRTRLREGAKHRANFAGRYIVVDWGCGSNCQVYALIDAVTGRVFDGSGAERGADFRLDSSLFIADPAQRPGDVAYSDDPVSSLPVRYLEWRDGKFMLRYVEACSVSDNHQKCGCEDVRELLFQTASRSVSRSVTAIRSPNRQQCSASKTMTLINFATLGRDRCG